MKWRSLTDSGRVVGDHISSPGWSPAFCRGPDTSTSESAAKNVRLGMSTTLGSPYSRYLTRIDRKSVVWGKRGSVGVERVGRGHIKKKKKKQVQRTKEKNN